MNLGILQTFGEDALQNHFQIIIPPHPGIGNILNLNARVLSVSIPDQTIETYTITKKGKTFTRPSGVSGQGNELSFTYRPDKYFETYKAISRWMNLIQDTTTGLMPLSDSGLAGIGGPSLYRVPITVLGMDANNIITGTWLFTGAYPVTQSGLDFSEDSGDPFEVTVTMNYVTITYPIV